jgi:hypothetical protein
MTTKGKDEIEKRKKFLLNTAGCFGSKGDEGSKMEID